MIKFKKRVNGSYYVVEAVPDTKRQELPVVSVYKNKAVEQQTVDVQAPTSNVQNASPGTTLSGNNIPQNRNGVKEAGTPILQRVEDLSKSGQAISVEEAKAASGYGDYGAKMLADTVNNTEGATFSMVNDAMRNAYLAGLTDMDSKKVSFETDLQIDAFTAGKKDAAMKRQKTQATVKSAKVQTLEKDLVQQGVPLADRQNILQAASEIEGSLAGTAQSVSSVVSGVRKITNNLVKVISQKVGNVQNPWHLVHTNLKALQSDTVRRDNYFTASYAGAYLDALKRSNPKRYGEVSAGVKNISDALAEFLSTGNMSEGIQNQEAFLSVAEDVQTILRMAEDMIGNAREQLYGEQLSSAKDVLSNENSNGIIETSTGAKVSYSLDESKRALPIGSMKNEFHTALTSREWVEYYNKVNEFDWDEELCSQEFAFAMKLNGKTILSTYKKGKPQVYYVTDNETNFEEGVLYDRTEAERILRLIRQNEIQRNETSGVGTDAISKGTNDDARGIAENFTQDGNGRRFYDGDKEVLYAGISKDIAETESEVNKNGQSEREPSGGIIETSTGAKVSYSFDENWHTDLTKAQVKMVEGWLRKAGSPEATKITNTANWYMGRLNGDDIFVIYSTEDAKGPTILYETRKNAKVEKDILMDILEAKENGKSDIGRKRDIDRLLGGNWMQGQRDMANSNAGSRNGGKRTGNAAVLQGKSPKLDGDVAFRNVIKNLFKIQESATADGGVNNSLEGEVNKNGQSEDLLSDDGGKRKYSKSSGGQTGKVDGRSRRHKEGREAARKRRKYCQTLKNAGHTRKRVILNHRCDVIPERHYTSEMRKVVRENSKRGIDETILVVGGIKLPEVDSNGKVKTARGMFIRTEDGRRIVVVQCDNEYYSPKQINDHEIVHNDYESERTQRVKNIILKTLPIKKRNELLGIIQDDYSGILEDLEGDALEELVADILSEMHYLSEDFLELSKAYWNQDDALLKRWEYEVSKKSFAKAVENNYIREVDRLNRQLVYDEHVQLREYIVSVNNSGKKLQKIDCKEIGNNFYIWENHGKDTYGILFSIPIEENKSIINAIRSGIENGAIRGAKSVSKWSANIRGGKGGRAVLGSRTKRTATHRGNDRLSTGQPESNARGYSGKSGRDTSGNRIKYALNENGMWEMEHIFENDDPEAEAAMMQEWKDALDQYGAIPKGENPARDIKVPKRTAKDKKVSRINKTQGNGSSVLMVMTRENRPLVFCVLPLRL